MSKKNRKRKAMALSFPFSKKKFIKWMEKVPDNATIRFVNVSPAGLDSGNDKNFIEAVYWEKYDKN